MCVWVWVCGGGWSRRNLAKALTPIDTASFVSLASASSYEHLEQGARLKYY